MIGIDLFSGAGGMSLGARLAGVDVQFAVECDRHAVQTYLRNHRPKHGMFAGDIRKVKGKRKKRRSDPLVIFGGPPCQGFSTSNQRTRSSKNQNNWLFQEFLRLVREYQPEWVVFENVKGILETEGGKFAERVISQIQDLGYATSSEVLNAKDFGVPQVRSRFFVVANKVGEKFEFPKPITRTPLTVKQAFQDLPVLRNGASTDTLEYKDDARNKYAKLMRGDLEQCSNNVVTNNAPHIVKRYEYIPQGGNWEDIPGRLMRNYEDRSRCHTGIYRRLRGSKPSVVIGNFRKNMLIHPTANRGLSVREAARLQSFPDSFVFEGSVGFQQQQVGNAVPPLLAKALFRHILQEHC